MNIIGVTSISFLHILFTVIWFGGMSVLLFAVMPAVKMTVPDKKLRQAILKKIQEKLSILTITSMLVLLTTGLLMTHRIITLSNLFDFSNLYDIVLSIKHILSIVIFIIAIIRRYYMDAIFGQKNPKKENYNFYLLLTNVILSYIVLFLSTYLPFIPL